MAALGAHIRRPLRLAWLGASQSVTPLIIMFSVTMMIALSGQDWLSATPQAVISLMPCLFLLIALPPLTQSFDADRSSGYLTQLVLNRHGLLPYVTALSLGIFLAILLPLILLTPLVLTLLQVPPVSFLSITIALALLSPALLGYGIFIAALQRHSIALIIILPLILPATLLSLGGLQAWQDGLSPWPLWRSLAAMDALILLITIPAAAHLLRKEVVT